MGFLTMHLGTSVASATAEPSGGNAATASPSLAGIRRARNTGPSPSCCWGFRLLQRVNAPERLIL
jgi:hypothetical protein